MFSYKVSGIWPTVVWGGNSLDHVYLKGEMGIEVQKPSTFLQSSLCEPDENLLIDEKKKIRKRG